MKSWTEGVKIPSLVLVLLAVALSGVLYWEWEQGRALEQSLLQLRKVPATPANTVGVLPEFALPEAEAGFPELVSRSLFTAGRRGTGSAARGGRSAMKKGQFVLVGVMITPRLNSALLRDVQTNRTETVAQGGEVRGMTLGEVTSTRVVLRQGAEVEELPLNVQMGPKGPAAAQPATLPPAASPAVVPSSAPPTSARPASAPASAAVPPPSKPAEGASAPKNPPPSPPSR